MALTSHNRFNYLHSPGAWNVLENSWITHSIWFNHSIEIAAICYKWTHMNMEAKGHAHFRLYVRNGFGWDFLMDEKERLFSFAAFSFVISSGHNHFISIFFDRHTQAHIHIYTRMHKWIERWIEFKRLRNKGQNVYLFLDQILFHPRIIANANTFSNKST